MVSAASLIVRNARSDLSLADLSLADFSVVGGDVFMVSVLSAC
jgi:hypothetical protein